MSFLYIFFSENEGKSRIFQKSSLSYLGAIQVSPLNWKDLFSFMTNPEKSPAWHIQSSPICQTIDTFPLALSFCWLAFAVIFTQREYLSFVRTRMLFLSIPSFSPVYLHCLPFTVRTRLFRSGAKVIPGYTILQGQAYCFRENLHTSCFG